MVYRLGPRRRRLHTREKSSSSATCCCASASHRRTICLSTYVWASGHIVLARDTAALSRLNECFPLEANNPCGSSVVEVESTRVASSPNVVAGPSRRRAIIFVASARGAAGCCATARLARVDDRDAAEGWWRCCPRLFLGGEAWWRGRLRAFDRAGATRVSRSFDREQDHVVAGTGGHELEAPEPNHRGARDRRNESGHLE